MAGEALILDWRKNDGGTMPLASVRVVEGYGVKTLPDADDGQMIVEITRLELETLRRRAYRAGRLAGRTKAERRVIEHGM